MLPSTESGLKRRKSSRSDFSLCRNMILETLTLANLSSLGRRDYRVFSHRTSEASAVTHRPSLRFRHRVYPRLECGRVPGLLQHFSFRLERPILGISDATTLLRGDHCLLGLVRRRKFLREEQGYFERQLGAWSSVWVYLLALGLVFKSIVFTRGRQ